MEVSCFLIVFHSLLYSIACTNLGLFLLSVIIPSSNSLKSHTSLTTLLAISADLVAASAASSILVYSTLCLNTMWMVYMISTGLSSAISIRVSNELDSGNPQGTQLSVSAAFIICLTEGIIVAIITHFVRDIWGFLYSNEPEVVKYVSAMIPVLAASDFMDGIQCTLSGVARGCGWQNICSIINLGAYYLVGIPSAVVFAFFLHFGGQVLWLGIICAMIVQLIVLIWIIVRTDWHHETMVSQGRVHKSQGNSESVQQEALNLP